MTFKDNLTRALKASGLSQTGLADLLEIQRPAVGQWLSGKTRPKGARLDAVAKALGVTVADLFAGDESAPEGIGGAGSIEQQPPQQFPPGGEGGIAVRKAVPSDNDASDEVDERAFVENVWKKLSPTKRAELFARYGMEMPSLLRKRG